ncbi:MAG: type III secretion system gatekeeper subunit SctW [Parachlamydiales bacterium]
MTDSGGVCPTDQAIAAALRSQRTEAKQKLAGQLAARRAMKGEMEEAFNPFSADKKAQFKALAERRRELSREEQMVGQRVQAKGEADSAADQKQNLNPELNKDQLLRLLEYLMGRGLTDPEALLEEVLKVFPDPSLADEALDFLLETTEGDLQETVHAARGLLNERMGREVAAGRNIAAEARGYSERGLGTATELRDLYRDITGNPRDHNTLFRELAAQYKFEQLRDVIDFLLHSLGADLRAKGPSISRGELYRLMTEARVLQSILQIYLFFQGREGMIARLMAEIGYVPPEELDFQTLSRTFVELVDERYPSAAKLYSLARELGISEEVAAQIVIFSQFRDAIRGVAPRIYRSLQHRYELLMAIIEALEELETKLEEEEEEGGL